MSTKQKEISLVLFPPRAQPRQGNQPTDIIKDESTVSVTETTVLKNHNRSESRSNSPMRIVSSRPESPSRSQLQKQPSLSPIIDSPNSAASTARSQSPTKSASSHSPRSQSPTSTLSSSSSSKNTTSSNKSSYLANAKLRAKEAWMRRKGSLSELDTMTTVQEHTMDSPTIPGRPPMHDRQSSLPAATWQHTMNEACKSALPRKPPSEFPMNIPVKNHGKTIHPSISTVQVPPASTITPAQSPTDENPPAVPPKESPKVSPLKINKPTPPAKSPTGTVAHANECQKVRVEVSHCKSRPATSPVKEQHKKELPKPDSIPNPENLPKPEPKNTLSTKEKKEATSEKTKRKSTNYRPLPSGLRPSDASKNLQPSVVDSLQKAARRTSERFGVLSPKDVDILTKELSQLEERCDYLRKTHKDLRKRRRELHEGMLRWLRSPVTFSREALLRQQEAFADLDNSIDDWEAKMERAEARRAQVHRKLLEHVAAALSVPPPRGVAVAPDDGMVTPPATPEETHMQHRESKKLDRIQSITVWALMSDVEDMLADKY